MQEEYRVAIFNIMVRRHLAKIRFEGRSEVGEGVDHICGYWEKSILGRGTNLCRGPEAQRYPAS